MVHFTAMHREAASETPKSLRDRKKQKTWVSIASSTVTLVARLGLDAVRVEDICELAEVGRSTFFRYFDSKEAAFVAGIHQGRLGAVTEAIRSRPEHENALTAVRKAFLEVYSDWREQRELMLLESQIRADSTQVQVRSLGQQVAWEASLAGALEPRLAESPRRTLHARLLAATIVSAVRMANEDWLDAGAARSPAKGLETALETVEELTSGRALVRSKRSVSAPRAQRRKE